MEYALPIIGIMAAVLVAAIGAMWAITAHYFKLVETKFEARFATIEARFAAIDLRFEKIEKRLDILEQRIFDLVMVLRPQILSAQEQRVGV